MTEQHAPGLIKDTHKTSDKPGTIMLVEDEPNLAFTLELNLTAEGYQVTVVRDGKKALDEIENCQTFHDLYLLDVNLPGCDGFEIAKTIRNRSQQAGIIFLTARAMESDAVRGLSLGADDYITKPFRINELLLKIRRALARTVMISNASSPSESSPHIDESTETRQPKIVQWGPFHLDTERLQIKTPSGLANLTRLEADMLCEFFENPNKVISRQRLLSKVWGVSQEVETRTVDNFIVRLRRLIETDPTRPRFLKSIRGRGYLLDSNTESNSSS